MIFEVWRGMFLGEFFVVDVLDTIEPVGLNISKILWFFEIDFSKLSLKGIAVFKEVLVEVQKSIGVFPVSLGVDLVIQKCCLWMHGVIK